jgi:capsular polysaccharide biosynthesis protein
VRWWHNRGRQRQATSKEKLQVDFWDLTKLVFRRWYIAVPLLILTGLAATYTTYTVKPDYKATAYVQLIPPPEASITTNIKELRNPWLDLGLGALNTAATYATVDRMFLNQLKTRGMSDNVVITNGYPAPIATVEVIGSSKETAMATAAQVVDRFNAVVKSLQDDYAVQTKGRILTRRLDTGNNLEETGGKVKRALVAVAGAGALLTAGLTVAFDALMRRRSRKRSRGEDGEVAPNEQRPRREDEYAETPAPAQARARRTEGEYVDRGSETVKIQLPNPNEVPRQRSVQSVNGNVRSNGVAARKPAEEPQLPPDATVVLPRPIYTKPGEGRGNKR